MTSADQTIVWAKNTVLFCRTYPGHPSQVAQVRRDIREITADCPFADDVILVASELCTNAVLHSRSGWPGGRFTVLATVYPGQSVWVEVIDQGGNWHARLHEDEPRHGLDIARAVAGSSNWGVDGDSSAGWIVWVRLHWPGN